MSKISSKMQKFLSMMICVIAIVTFCCSSFALTTIQITRVIQTAEGVFLFADVFDSENGNALILGQEEFEVRINNHSVQVQKVNVLDNSGHGIHYVVVVDLSRAIPDGMGKAKEGLQLLAQGLTSKDTFTLISCGKNGTEVLLRNESNLQTIQSAIKGIKTASNDSNTKFYDGLKLAMDIAQQETEDVLGGRVVVGFASVRIEDASASITSDELASALQKAGTPLYMVGYGTDNNKIAVLGQASRASGGGYYNAAKANDAVSILAAIQKQIQRSYLITLDTSMLAQSVSGDADVSIRVHGATGSIQVPLQIAVAEKTLPPPRSTPTPTPEITVLPTPYATLQSTESVAAQENVVDNTNWLWAIPVALIGLLLLVAVVVMMRGKSPAKQSVIIPNVHLNPLAETKFKELTATLNDDYLNKTIAIDDINERRSLTDTIKIDIGFSGIMATLETLPLTRSIGKPKTHTGANVVTVFIDDCFTIGRSNECDFVIEDGTVGKRHAMMLNTMGVLEIKDLNSTNGTRIDGQLITAPTEVPNGGIVTFGLVQIKITY